MDLEVDPLSTTPDAVHVENPPECGRVAGLDSPGMFMVPVRLG